MDDHELLRRFARDRSQDAFRELVERHLPMVYATARRIVGDAHLAEEVAQEVFKTLAQKAGTLQPPQVVGGWLYSTARNLALHAVRSEQRRREREQVAVAMQALETNPGEFRIDEHLEPALAELEADERDVLVLRFLEDRSLREVGVEFGISEDAARMRVNRALEQLRAIFSRRGITATSGLLGVAMVASTTGSAAPAGLAAAVTNVALAGTAATALAATHTVVTTMNWINAKAIAATLAAAVIAGTATYLVQEKQMTRLEAEKQAMAAEFAQLKTEHKTALATAQSREEELERLRKDTAELMRLRAQGSTLRAAQAAAGRAGKPVAEPTHDPSPETQTNANPEEREKLLAKHMFNSVKLLGLLARIRATYSGEQFPTNLDQLRSFLPATLPGSTELERFELLDHGRPLTTSEPSIILVRERFPRQRIDGSWARVYCMTDGSTVERVCADTNNFQLYERQFLPGAERAE